MRFGQIKVWRNRIFGFFIVIQDLFNHNGIFDGNNDFYAATTLAASFTINSEYALFFWADF